MTPAARRRVGRRRCGYSPDGADGAEAGDAGETGLAADAGETGLAADAGVIGLAADTGETGLAADAGETGLAADAGETGLAADFAETAETAETAVVALPALREAGSVARVSGVAVVPELAESSGVVTSTPETSCPSFVSAKATPAPLAAARTLRVPVVSQNLRFMVCPSCGLRERWCPSLDDHNSYGPG